MRYVGEGPTVLDFDCENRPLSYLGQDFTTAEVTCIAWAFVLPGKRPRVASVTLGEDTLPEMLAAFREAYDQADLVTGHNIIRHDLPMLNGMSLEQGMGPLPPVMVQDTYRHLRRKQGVSGSQESLAAMLGVRSPKLGMNQKAWREANRLTMDGIALTRARCVADVKQHVEMRQRLLELGWLRPPQRWG